MNKTGLATLVGLFSALTVGCSHNAGYYANRADQFAKRGECAEALLNYRNAIRHDSSLGSAYYGLGVCQFKLGYIAESAQTLFRAVDLMPSNDEAAIEAADVALTLYVQTGRPTGLYNRASKIVDEILKRNPQSPDGLRLRGSILLDDRKFREAITTLQRADSLRPSDPDIRLLLAEALLRDGKPGEGERMVTEIVGQHPKYSAGYEWLLQKYLSSDRQGEAERLLKSRVQNLPDEFGGIIQLASLYRREQNAPEMKRTLSLILDHPEKFKYRFLVVGDFYRSGGAPGEAADCYRQGLESDKDSTATYQGRLAGVFMAQNKRGDALKAINAALKQAPSDAELLNLRALILVEGGDQKELARAIADCKTAIHQRPQDAATYFLIGRAYWATHDRESARNSFTEAIRRNSKYVEPRIALAQLARERNDFQAALRFSEEALQLDARNPRARILHAAALVGSGDLPAGKREMSTLALDYPTSEEVQLELGLLFLAENQLAAAQKIFAKQLQSHSEDTRALAGLTRVYIAQRNYEGAIHFLSDSVQASPNWPEAREFLASTALAGGRLDIAFQQYKILADKFPASAEYKIHLAEIYQAQGDKSNAIQTYEAARKLAPDDPVIIGRLGILRDSMGQKKEADEDYRRSLALDPSDPALLNNRAFFIAESGGDLDEGLRLIMLALKRMPDDPGILDTLGWLYTKKRMNDSAINILNKLVKAHPDEPAFRFHLGVALLQKGDGAGAKREFETGLSKHPSKEDEEKIRSFLREI